MQKAAKAAAFFRHRSSLLRYGGRCSALGALAALELQLFLDACRTAAAFAQVVQLGAAHITAALDFDRSDHRAVGLERAFHAFAAGDLAHGEATVQAAIALGNHNAFVGLHA